MCFVRAKEDLAEYKLGFKKSVDPPTNYTFWRPFSLEFIKSTKENLYRQVTYPLRCTQDLQAYCLVLPLEFIRCYALRDSLPFGYVCAWLVLLCFLTVAHIYVDLRHR